jgi:hypothetical protein
MRSEIGHWHARTDSELFRVAHDEHVPIETQIS